MSAYDLPEFEESPFNRSKGIYFKYGTWWSGKEREVERFNAHWGVVIPQDFLELIGEYCEAGFDGLYKVKKHKKAFIFWSHLLLMKVKGRGDEPGYDIARIAKEHSFLLSGKKLKYLPFGEAFIGSILDHFTKQASDIDSGFLVFDPANGYEVRFLGKSGKQDLWVASTFSKMMAGASYVSWG